MIDDQTAPVRPARATLKLKSGPSPSRKEVAVQAPEPTPAPVLKRSASPKTTWSEPYIRQMQAEMDKLAGR